MIHIRQTALYLAFYVILTLFSSCSSSHERFFTHKTALIYPPSQTIRLFEYVDIDINELLESTYSNYLLIGKSRFYGRYTNPKRAKSYAQSIGSDLLITSYRTKKNNSKENNEKKPRYHQESIFLKRVNAVKALWEEDRSDYPKTATHNLEGIWENERFAIELYQSKDYMVAVISDLKGKCKFWHKHSLKLRYKLKTGKGFYLMRDKAPLPAVFHINKFGHFTVTILAAKKSFSFARRNPHKKKIILSSTSK